MARPRGTIQSVIEGFSEVARFRHPLLKKIVRVNLGRGNEAVENLRVLNLISKNQEYWLKPPKGEISETIRLAWYGEPEAGAVAAEADSKSGVKGASGEKVDVTPGRVAILESLLQGRDATIAKKNNRIRVLEKQLEDALGRKVRRGPCPTVKQALADFLAGYLGRDKDHTRNVTNDLKRFSEHFQEDRLVDWFDGKERQIEAWLRGLGVSPSRRAQVRTYVLKFLEHAGLKIDREKVEGVGINEIRIKRGPIRWLERKDAEALRDKLMQPWRDMWRVQVSMGLRPDELLTLKRGDFNADHSELTLSPHKHLTLKTGSRRVQIPKPLRKMFEQRLDAGELVFPAVVHGCTLRKGLKRGEKWTGDWQTRGGAVVWKNAKNFNKYYNGQLEAAAVAAGITMKVECRTGRRTCGSLLLRSINPATGKRYSVEDVAAILGDKPKTIYEHYGRILSGEVDPTGAVI